MLLKSFDYYKNINIQALEPEIVKITRSLIQDTFKDLYFKEEKHEYMRFVSNSIKKYECVSNIIHLFEPYTDWEEVSKNYAEKYSLEVEYVRESWKQKALIGTTRGSCSHNYGEKYFYFFLGEKDKLVNFSQFKGGYLIPNVPKEEAIVKFWDFVEKEKSYPVLAELKAYLDKYGISGTLDLLFYIEGRGFVIRDYKTNENLYKDFKKPMLYPFEHLNCEDKSYYTIQLSLYQIFLEEIGIPIAGRELIWLKDNAEFELVGLEDETKRLRKYFDKNKCI